MKLSEIHYAYEFLNYFIFYNDVQFLTTFTQLTTRFKKLFKGLVVGFEPKEMTGRMCDSVKSEVILSNIHTLQESIKSTDKNNTTK